MDMKIRRKDIIKPEVSIPSHLQTYRLSLLDQLNRNTDAPHLIYFYPATTAAQTINLSRLRMSLPKTLSIFHPLAGRLSQDGLISFHGKDDGATYVEAEVKNFSLKELIMSKPNNACLLRQLVPQEDPFAVSGSVLTAQATVFSCGGIAITISGLHAIMDGRTSFCFKKAWATAARMSSSELIVVPCFDSRTSFFLPNQFLSKDYAFWVDALIEPGNSNCVTRRFVFDSSALSSLRRKASGERFVKHPSRFEAVMGLVWGRCIEALKTINKVKRPSIFSTAVDLRRRTVPTLPEEAFGNLVWPAIAVCRADENAELERLAALIRDATNKIDAEFVSKIRNNLDEACRELLASYTAEGVGDYTDFFTSSSLMKMGMHELDFGFGKPQWVAFGITDIPEMRNSFDCIETKEGDGIEVWVTLKEDEMKVLERDAELLLFASLDPCPFACRQISSFQSSL